MNNIAKGFAFAAAMLLVAWAGNTGLMPRDMTKTLIIVLPALAVLTLRGRTECALFRRKEA